MSYKIVYTCPSTNVAVGGIKQIYKNSEMLSKNGFNSVVWHPDNHEFVCDWFEHQATVYKSNKLNKDTDFVILPEVMWGYAKVLLKYNVKYALYVQGGYLIERGVTSDNYSEFMDVYEQASLIMSISDDTTAVVMMNFPNMAKNKIVRLIPYLSDSFKSDTKENIISYMPRRLPEHIDKVCFYLRNKLPPTWSLKPIQNLNETETASLLAKSSIFMSFSNQEGFGLPPLEAALSGAIVVGYTGQGGKEFFQSPNFHSVENGDFITFVSMVLNSIKAVESGALTEESFLKGREKLKIRYSIVEYERLLIEFAQRVGNFYR